MQLHQPHGHVRQVGHHVVVLEEAPHGAQHLGDIGIAPEHDLVEGLLRGIIPVPRILEGFDLRLARVP